MTSTPPAPGRPAPPRVRGTTPEVLARVERVRELLARVPPVRRKDMPGMLGVSEKQVDHAFRVMRAQPAAGTPRRAHRAVYRPAGPAPDWGWASRAACRGRELVLFFGPEGERTPERKRRESEAASVCAGCPVRDPCLDYAIGRPEKSGTWGGLNEDDRASERRKRMRRASELRAGETAA